MATALQLTPAELARNDARELADEILAGKYPNGPWGQGGFYSLSDWRNAAQYLVDSDDHDEVIYMIGTEESAERGELHLDRGDLAAERWADEADFRYDLMREEQMLAAWEQEA
jgi:hypothetical protein